MPANDPYPEREDPAVLVQDLDVRRGGKRVLPSISLRVRRGAVTALLGPSGSGKTTFREDLVALRKALRGVPRVVLVNVRVPRSWEAQVDDALAETREWWPAVRVADWHAASGRSGLLYDGVHPNAEGQRIYARLVARTLRSG